MIDVREGCKTFNYYFTTDYVKDVTNDKCCNWNIQLTVPFYLFCATVLVAVFEI